MRAWAQLRKSARENPVNYALYKDGGYYWTKEQLEMSETPVETLYRQEIRRYRTQAAEALFALHDQLPDLTEVADRLLRLVCSIDALWDEVLNLKTEKGGRS
jgi:hypothetical protein